MGMKLAVSGKGGVGKTTVTALILDALRKRGETVVAIDADPDSNLAATLGYSSPDEIRPLVDLKELIEERTGVKPGTTGGMFRLNPFVEDIPENHSVDIDGIRLLVAGAVKKGGAGCYCPENSLLRALVSHLLLEETTTLVLDMEAGVEHFGRGTVQAVDQLIVVVNPGLRSIETALRIRKMAEAIGLTKISAVGNMVRSDSDRDLIRRELDNIPVLGFVSYDETLRDADIAGSSVISTESKASDEVAQIVDELYNSNGR